MKNILLQQIVVKHRFVFTLVKHITVYYCFSSEKFLAVLTNYNSWIV